MVQSKLPPPELNLADFSQMCGVVPASVRDWIGKGMPGSSKPTVNSMYIDLQQAVPWCRDNVWRKDDVRAQKLRAETDILQMNRDLQSGLLVEARVVMEQWSAELATMRARLLSLPATTAARLAGANLTPAQIQEILRVEVCDALSGLSGTISPEEDLVASIPEPPKRVGAGRPGKYAPRVSR